MSKEQWNGEQFRYFIRYRLDEPGANWTEFEVEDPLQDRVVLRNLPTFRRYQLQVGAVNTLGKALIDPEIKSGYSGEAGNKYNAF